MKPAGSRITYAPPSLPEARGQRSFVVVHFEPLGDKVTRITLHHTGWGDRGEWDKVHAYFDCAWGNALVNLRKRLDSGPRDWTAWPTQLKTSREQQAEQVAASAPARECGGRDEAPRAAAMRAFRIAQAHLPGAPVRGGELWSATRPFR